jgi:hypothetical protein
MADLASSLPDPFVVAEAVDAFAYNTAIFSDLSNTRAY